MRMINAKFIAGMLAMALVFGMIGCDNGTNTVTKTEYVPGGGGGSGSGMTATQKFFYDLAHNGRAYASTQIDLPDNFELFAGQEIIVGASPIAMSVNSLGEGPLFNEPSNVKGALNFRNLRLRTGSSLTVVGGAAVNVLAYGNLVVESGARVGVGVNASNDLVTGVAPAKLFIAASATARFEENAILAVRATPDSVIIEGSNTEAGTLRLEPQSKLVVVGSPSGEVIGTNAANDIIVRPSGAATAAEIFDVDVYDDVSKAIANDEPLDPAENALAMKVEENAGTAIAANPEKETTNPDKVAGLLEQDATESVTYEGGDALPGGGEDGDEPFTVPEGKTLVIAGTIAEQADDIIVDEGGTLKVEGSLTTSGDLEVADGGTLEVAGDLTIGTGDNGTLTVEGEITVGDSGILTLAEGSTGNLNGEIVVEKGGILKDLNSGGGTLWEDEGEGSITIDAGGTAYVGDETVKMISPDAYDADEPVPVLIQLTDGGFTISKGGYELDGKATLFGIFGLGGEGETITLSATSVLTIDATWAPEEEPSAPYPGLWLVETETKIVGETVGTDSSKIVIVDGGIYITGGTNNFYDAQNVQINASAGIGEGTYNWDEDADGSNNAGWKAEPEPEPEAETEPATVALSE